MSKNNIKAIQPPKKSGFAVLVGRSNVGKSTLLNALVGTKVAITSPKPQTTRQTIHGIVHDPRGQAVFMDTPGVFEKAHDRLTKRLNMIARDSLRDIDLVVYVVDPTRAVGNEEHIVLRLLENTDAPKILAINKTDLRDLPYLGSYEALAARFDQTVSISAEKGRGLKQLLDAVFELLPEGEPIYPEFQVTNLNQKFWIAELIREKIFTQLHAEIPYSAGVEINEMEKRENGLIYIRATILTAAERYKGMIIGAGGRKIKEIGAVARKELEIIWNSKVFLDLQVEVDERWLDRLVPLDCYGP
ncbi:GTPase Era [Patescibacteria group bacterium]|nr:MAG: GTPase Era [Patescibacteria group bacterium]